MEVNFEGKVEIEAGIFEEVFHFQDLKKKIFVGSTIFGEGGGLFNTRMHKVLWGKTRDFPELTAVAHCIALFEGSAVCNHCSLYIHVLTFVVHWFLLLLVVCACSIVYLCLCRKPCFCFKLVAVYTHVGSVPPFFKASSAAVQRF